MEKTIKIIKFCRDIPATIKINDGIIKDLEDQYYNPIRAADLDGMPKGKGGTSNPTEQTALNVPDSVSDMLHRLKTKNENLNKLYKEIMLVIQSLEYREQKIIYEFYIKQFNWEKVSNGFYSVRQCKNIRNAAIKKLKIKFGENKEIKYLLQNI